MKKLLWQKAQEYISENKKVFLMFSTSWCPDCKMMKPVILELESKTNDIKFIEVDAEEADFFRKPNISWQVLKVPAFYLIIDQEARFIGYEYIPQEILEREVLKETN